MALSAMVLSGVGLAQATGLLANWTLNDAGAIGNTIGNSATIADSSGNGFTGTVVSGGDTLTSMAGVIGNGMYFSGDDSTSYAYISAPANVPGLSLGGMDSLTISLWVNIPSYTLAGSNKTKGALDLYDTISSTSPECYTLGTEYGGLATQKGLYYGFQGTPVPGTDNSGSTNFWNRGSPTGWVANTWEQITMVYSAGTETYLNPNTGLVVKTGVGFLQYYVNGLLVSAPQIGTPGSNVLKPIASAAGANIAIGCYYPNDLPGYTQMWYGGLNDIGLWQDDLTATYSIQDQWISQPAPALGTAAGGEVGALYNVPMYNGHTGALSQYGVSAMDKLFTLYDTEAAGTTAVTTSNGTLTWQYVSGGLSATGGSGYAGYNATTKQYFVQLDSNGGGVETVVAPTPEPGTLALLTAGLAGLLAYAWRKAK
jgi:hypothetical protein